MAWQETSAAKIDIQPVPLPPPSPPPLPPPPGPPTDAKLFTAAYTHYLKLYGQLGVQEAYLSTSNLLELGGGDCVPDLMSKALVESEQPKEELFPPEKWESLSSDVLDQQCFRACFNDEIGFTWIDGSADYAKLDQKDKITGEQCPGLAQSLYDGIRSFAGSLKKVTACIRTPARSYQPPLAHDMAHVGPRHAPNNHHPSSHAQRLP